MPLNRALAEELRELASGPAAQNPANVNGVCLMLNAANEIDRLHNRVQDYYDK